MTLLAGDLGGTKTLLGLYDDSGTLLYQRRFDSQGHDSLESMVALFLQDPEVTAHPRPEKAAIGVAGPVEQAGEEQRTRLTNLSWGIDTSVLAQAADLRKVLLVNDFYAVAAATSFLSELAHPSPAELVPLNPSASPQKLGSLAVLGAGTGLGEAIIARPTGTAIIVPSEGGHSDFAPKDDVEIEVLRFLRRRHGGHVSWERVVCGAGLLSLYEFFREFRSQSGSVHVPPDLHEALSRDRTLAPALVSSHGLAGDDPTCVEALHLFVKLYGAEAGNLALKCLATGGVFLAGGIAAKILPKMQDGTFLEGFVDKGRFSSLCKSIPVHVIMSPEIGLLGAAVLARGL